VDLTIYGGWAPRLFEGSRCRRISDVRSDGPLEIIVIPHLVNRGFLRDAGLAEVRSLLLLVMLGAALVGILLLGSGVAQGRVIKVYAERSLRRERLLDHVLRLGSVSKAWTSGNLPGAKQLSESWVFVCV
jgi:hypothetical protein